jgi:diguanylate cyclase (GGDEF)-like protein
MQEQHTLCIIARKFLILILIVSLLAGCAPKKAGSEVKAFSVVDGTADLSELPANQMVKLDGAWRFYWKQLLSAEEVQRYAPDAYVQVPGSWTEYSLAHGSAEARGYATYAVRLEHLKPGTGWALELPSMSTAYSLWVNGKLLVRAGVVSKDPKLTESYKEKRVISFSIDSPTADIVIQMANSVSLRGGLTQSIRFGEENTVRQAQMSKVAYDMFLAGALLIMSLYHFGLFLMRKKESSPLYFGLFCCIVALRGLLTGETVMYRLFPELNWMLAIKLEYGTLSLSVIAFTLFLRRIFPKEMPAALARAVSLVCTVYFVLTTLLPVQKLAMTLPYFQVFILLSISCALYIFVRALARKREGALLSVLGASLLTVSIFNDVLFNRGFINTGYYLTLGLLAFIVAQSFILAISFSKAFSSSEELAVKLQQLNISLEEKVRERTLELEQLNDTLRKQTLIDGMTGIPNRRHFEEVSVQLLSRADGECSLLLLDIDHFKGYNDTYGHLVGDDCLRAVAASMQDEASAVGATAARYGGEEFVVIAPFGRREAEQLAQRIVVRIRSLNIPHRASRTAPHVTISCGVTSVSAERGCPALQQLLQEADEALYKAKQTGRDRYDSKLGA